MGEINFQIFGSQDSIDVDIMIFLDSLPSIEKCKQLCEDYKEVIKNTYTNKLRYELEKDIDINLGVIRNGILVDVFKGTPDEVNNSLYYTYDYHKKLQPYFQQISRAIERDKHLKMLRSSRIILSLLSRTEYRTSVKKALKTTFKKQIELIEEIDFSKAIDFGTKNGSKEDILKRFVFQMGQTIALYNGFDIYSKSSIRGMFPKVAKLMDRCEEISNCELEALEELKRKYTYLMSKEFHLIGDVNEKSYLPKKNVI